MRALSQEDRGGVFAIAIRRLSQIARVVRGVRVKYVSQDRFAKCRNPAARVNHQRKLRCRCRDVSAASRTLGRCCFLEGSAGAGTSVSFPFGGGGRELRPK
jgi:hypothetical protein